MYKLSIVIPAVPGRLNRLKAIFSRLTLNAVRHKDIPFEVIVVDGSLNGEYRELSEYVANIIPVKYVSLPIGKFINAGYPRNVGFRFAQGEIFCQVDIDWWLSEDFIAGAAEPFEKGLCVLNNGFMIDTSESKNNSPGYIEALGEFLLTTDGVSKEFLSICGKSKIPGPVTPTSIWLWAAPRNAFFTMQGYDEMYCRQFSYSREDDDLFFRFMALGLPRYGDSYKTFAGLHIHHPAAQRGNSTNELNKQYFKKMCGDKKAIIVRNIARNENHEWGKGLRMGYAIIDGVTYNSAEMETWIRENNQNVKSYDYLWNDIGEYMKVLENLT